MAEPATKKELAALEKKVDQLSKAFEAEKKVVHTDLGEKALASSTDENFKRVKDAFGQFRKWTEDTFAERKRWFDDEKGVVHGELDALTKRIETEEKWTKDTFEERKRWFDDEK